MWRGARGGSCSRAQQARGAKQFTVTPTAKVSMIKFDTNEPGVAYRNQPFAILAADVRAFSYSIVWRFTFGFDVSQPLPEIRGGTASGPTPQLPRTVYRYL